MSSRTVPAKPTLATVDDVLTAEEERKVRTGEGQLKHGQSEAWRAVKRRLGD
jgi:hypothetical protein